MSDERKQVASVSTPPRPEGWRRALRIVVTWAILAAAVYYLGAGLRSQWVELRTYAWHIRYSFLVPAFLMTSMGYWMLGLGWHLGLGKLGCAASWRWTLRAWWVGNLAKYVPGRVWIVFTRLRYSEDAGVPGVAAAAGFVLESLCLMASGLLLFILLLPAHTAVQEWHYLLCLLGVPCLGMLHPRLFNAMTGLAIRILRLPAAPFHLKLTDLALLLAYFTLAWFVFGLGIALMAHSFAPFTLTQAVSFAGSHSFSFVAAMVSFVTPGGIAVREAILSELIRKDFPTMAIVIALASRVWITVVEVANVGLSLALTAGARPAETGPSKLEAPQTSQSQ